MGTSFSNAAEALLGLQRSELQQQLIHNDYGECIKQT